MGSVDVRLLTRQRLGRLPRPVFRLARTNLAYGCATVPDLDRLPRTRGGFDGAKRGHRVSRLFASSTRRGYQQVSCRSLRTSRVEP